MRLSKKVRASREVTTYTVYYVTTVSLAVTQISIPYMVVHLPDGGTLHHFSSYHVLNNYSTTLGLTFTTTPLKV